MPPVLCSVPGCERESFVNCDRCLVPVCDRHNPTIVCLELCPDCYAVLADDPPEEWKEDEDAETEEDRTG